MHYLQSLENALETQIKNGLLLSESLQALLSHASSQVEQYPSLLIRRAASTLAMLNTMSEECEAILKILSPNSLLDKEFQTKPVFTNQPKLPSSVFLSKPQTDLPETTLAPQNTLDSGSLSSDIGVSINPPSPSPSKKKIGQKSARGSGSTLTK